MEVKTTPLYVCVYVHSIYGPSISLFRTEDLLEHRLGSHSPECADHQWIHWHRYSPYPLQLWQRPCYFSSFTCSFFSPTALLSLAHHYNFQLFHCHPFVNVYLHIPQEICPIILHHDALSLGPGFSTIFFFCIGHSLIWWWFMLTGVFPHWISTVWGLSRASIALWNIVLLSWINMTL